MSHMAKLKKRADTKSKSLFHAFDDPDQLTTKSVTELMQEHKEKESKRSACMSCCLSPIVLMVSIQSDAVSNVVIVTVIFIS